LLGGGAIFDDSRARRAQPFGLFSPERFPMHDERKTAPIEAKLPKRSRSKPLSPVLKAAPTTSGEQRLQLAVRS
jgi:hypothetical protein